MGKKVFSNFNYDFDQIEDYLLSLSSDDEKKTKSSKKSKKSKDQKGGEKEKKPLSGFMLFLSQNREGIKKENPDIKVTEVGKKAGEMWGKLSDKEKAKFKV